MAHCTPCGKDIADEFAFCPTCGARTAPEGPAAASGPTIAPPASEPNHVLRNSGIFVVLLIAGIAWYNGAHAPTPTTATAASDTQSTEATAEPAQSDEVVTGPTTEVAGLRYTLNSSIRTATFGPEYSIETANGEFIIVSLTIKNVGSKPATISDSDFHLERGETQFDSSNASMTNGGFFLSKLNPGTSKTGTIAFDVPANTAPSKYRLVLYGNDSNDRKAMTLR